MLKIYLKIIYRKIFGQGSNNLINLLGLSLAGASIILLYIMVSSEFSFERTIPNFKNIYRVNYSYENNKISEKNATTPFPLTAEIKKAMPNKILAVGQLFNYLMPYHMLVSDLARHYETTFYFANSDFLRIFNIKLMKGSLTNFSKPNQVIISETAAKSYFPNGKAIGQNLYYENEVPLKVVGIFKDLPRNTHLKINFLASLATTHLETFENWVWRPVWTYVQLTNSETEKELKMNLQKISLKKYNQPENKYISFQIQKIQNIHLNSKLQNENSVNSKEQYVWILIILGVAIFTNAFINLYNLTTSTLLNRRKEFFVKKVVGAQKEQLFWQIWVETFLITGLALFLAFVFAEWMSPMLFWVYQQRFNFYEIINLPFTFFALIFNATISTIIAFFAQINISKTKMLRYQREKWKKFKNLMNQTRIFVLIQYTLSVSFLIIALLNSKQLYLIVNADLGFRTENVKIVPVFDSPVADNFATVVKDLDKVKEISSFCGLDNLPGLSFYSRKLSFGSNADDLGYIPSIRFWHNISNTFDLKFIQKNKDTIPKLYINERLHQILKLKSLNSKKRIDKIDLMKQKFSGVVENFHVSSLFQPVIPLALKKGSNKKSWQMKYLAFHIPLENEEQAKSKIRRICKKFMPGKPILFLDLKKIIDKQYFNERIFAVSLFFFSLISFLISLVGLVGLMGFLSEQKTREIAIHKIMGAKLTDIILLYFKEIIIIIVIATFLAFPIAYFTMSKWLNVFALESNLSGFLFIEGALLCLFSTLLIIAFFAYRIYNKNTIEAVKYE